LNLKNPEGEGGFRLVKEFKKGQTPGLKSQRSRVMGTRGRGRIVIDGALETHVEAFKTKKIRRDRERAALQIQALAARGDGTAREMLSTLKIRDYLKLCKMIDDLTQLDVAVRKGGNEYFLFVF
jgi:hypothetical protein